MTAERNVLFYCINESLGFRVMKDPTPLEFKEAKINLYKHAKQSGHTVRITEVFEPVIVEGEKDK